jgi:hypothetical protein
LLRPIQPGDPLDADLGDRLLGAVLSDVLARLNLANQLNVRALRESCSIVSNSRIEDLSYVE